MQLPIGVSDFKEIITYRDDNAQPYLFIDKSLFIKEIIGNGIKASVITRPRRFGKTLNMSILHYFCAELVDGEPTKGLFDNLKIAQFPKAMAQQGKYPVIFLTFKDIKQNAHEKFYTAITGYLRKVYASFAYLLDSSAVSTIRVQGARD